LSSKRLYTGLLLRASLEGINAYFSLGVSTELGFELACAQYGMDVFMIDRSVESQSLKHPCCRFQSLFLGSISAGNCITLEDWVNDSFDDPSSDLLLQMDIQGSEWDALISVLLQLLLQIRVIVIELHSITQLWSQSS
jgi:hypothetical protein